MPTQAQLNFLAEHIRQGPKGGRLKKFYAQQAWQFVARLRDEGWIEIIDPENQFPQTWQGTRLTQAGRDLLIQHRVPFRTKRGKYRGRFVAADAA